MINELKHEKKLTLIYTELHENPPSHFQVKQKLNYYTMQNINEQREYT